MPGLSIRTFRWSDLSALVRLMNLVREADGDERLVGKDSLREILGQPGLMPEENCYLWEWQSQIWACGLLHPELPIKRAVLEVHIHPDHRSVNLQTQMLATAYARAKALKSTALHFCISTSSSWKEATQLFGFAEVRTYWMMQWERTKPPLIKLPQGFTIRTYQPGEGATLSAVQNEAFAENWGFSPNSPEEVEYRAAMSITSPTGILFLNHGYDTAGYCWTGREMSRSGALIGSIGMIGTHPTYRGIGLSRPILAAGMQHLHSLGVQSIRLDVDAENTSAIKLYDSTGFRKAGELHWFEKLVLGS